MTLLTRETGPLINAIAALAGSLIGLSARGIPERFQKVALQGVSLAVLAIGLNMAILGHVDLLLVTISLAVGALIGELIGIEAAIEGAARRVERRLHQSGGRFVEGFMLALTVWCVGSMAIVGALQSGLGDPRILFTKAVLDGVSGIFFASALGFGVVVAVLPLLLYEGAIALGAAFLSPILGTAEIGPLTGAGGLLIVAIGLNMLGVTKIRTANLLPALVVAAVLGAVKAGLHLPI